MKIINPNKLIEDGFVYEEEVDDYILWGTTLNYTPSSSFPYFIGKNAYKETYYKSVKGKILKDNRPQEV
jgi:hypothetical protein